MRQRKKQLRNLMVWVLAFMLIVTMSIPAAAFGETAEDSGVSKTAGEAAALQQADENGNAGTDDPGTQNDTQGQTGGTADPQENPSGDSSDPSGGSSDPAADPTDPTDPGIDPTNPTDPSVDPAIDPTQPTQPEVPPVPKYRSVYRVEKTGGVLRCYWYSKSGVKRSYPQKDKYYIVKFDKNSKSKGTAIKKLGRSGTLYYFDKNGKGKKYTGWYKYKKKSYYFRKGTRLKGTNKIGKIWYKFSSKAGSLLRRIGDDVDYSIQSYSSRSSYLVIVKLSEHKVRIYKGKRKNWTRAHTFKCTNGAPSTPTVKGTFTIGSRGSYFNTGSNARCWYWTQFYGNYLFHSVIYDRSSSPVNILDGRLGISASHGCIRMALSNAKWFYNNIPRGTKVVVW